MFPGYTRKCDQDNELTDNDTGYHGPHVTNDCQLISLSQSSRKHIIRLQRRGEINSLPPGSLLAVTVCYSVDILLFIAVEMFQWVEMQSMDDNRTVYSYSQRSQQEKKRVIRGITTYI